MRMGAGKSCGSAFRRVAKACGPPVEAPIARHPIAAIVSLSAVGGMGAGGAKGLRTPCPIFMSRSIRVSSNSPARLPAAGLSKVSAAPSVIARTEAAAPSAQAEETMRTLAPPLRSISAGSAVSPSVPGMLTSRRMMSTGSSARSASAWSALDATAAILNASRASMKRDKMVRATNESSTIISLMGAGLCAGTGLRPMGCGIMGQPLRRRRRSGACFPTCRDRTVS
jgi:hypothetical protein